MKFCCAYGCNNSGSLPGISFFQFPKDDKRKKEWTCRINRDNFQPSSSSVLCSDHFSRDSYTYDQGLLRRLGVNSESYRLRLKPDAVPTIFEHKPQKQERSSAAVTKRRKIEVG